MQMLCISISFIQKHMILTYRLVECNLNTLALPCLWGGQALIPA